MKIHHLGIACLSIEKTIKYLENIFPNITFKDILYDPIQNAYLTISDKYDGMRFELIQGEKIEKFVSKNVPLYHICFEVQDIEKEVNFLKKEGGIIISNPVPAILFNGRKVSFIYTDIGIVELLEAKN
tara:strand:- start:605 stop:988 length:384 start_codon:yes stop_codon:yes gene_type:complete